MLLENYYRLAEDLSNAARELRALIDDSQSIIFINLDREEGVIENYPCFFNKVVIAQYIVFKAGFVFPFWKTKCIKLLFFLS